MPEGICTDARGLTEAAAWLKLAPQANLLHSSRLSSSKHHWKESRMCLTQKTLSQRSSSIRYIPMVSHAAAGPTVHCVQAAWLACDHLPNSPPATPACADPAEASLGDLDRFISMLRKQVWQLYTCVTHPDALLHFMACALCTQTAYAT